MFKEIQQGLELYRQKVGEYSMLVQKVKAEYPDDWDPFLYSKGTIRDLEAWNARLNGMAEVLGLTEEENKTIWGEFGIEYQSYAEEETEEEASL